MRSWTSHFEQEVIPRTAKQDQEAARACSNPGVSVIGLSSAPRTMEYCRQTRLRVPRLPHLVMDQEEARVGSNPGMAQPFRTM
eukprot:11935469-Heterocapsa_arctica.AAC.1